MSIPCILIDKSYKGPFTDIGTISWRNNIITTTMNSCFGCLRNHHKKSCKNVTSIDVKEPHKHSQPSMAQPLDKPKPVQQPRREDPRKVASEPMEQDIIPKQNGNIGATNFSYRELATATKNFRQECLIGEGGFGRVYKGRLEKTGQIVAVKQLDRNGLQGNKEFLVEVLMLNLLAHPNLVNLIGYSADGDQRLLVYEFMPLGSLEDHIFDLSPGQPPLSWTKRMRIALDAAKGLEYLHDKANPPVIYRDLKSSNILLDKNYNAKLSDFGLAKLGPVGGLSHVSTRVMGTYGYCAPEYQRTGQLTVKSDVYSFGVVLLELITGRRAIDTSRRGEEQILVTWAEPMFKNPSKFIQLADPELKGEFPKKSVNQAVAIAAMCLQNDAQIRPLMSDVVTALSYLAVRDSASASVAASPLSSPTPTFKSANEVGQAEETAQERQKAVKEAMEWVANSRTGNT